MNKRIVIIAVALLAVASLIVGACTVLISTSTEGSEKSQQTPSISIYKADQMQGDPDDLGGGFRNNL